MIFGLVLDPHCDGGALLGKTVFSTILKEIAMQCKTLVIWWLINGKKPKLLEEEDKIIKNLEPLVKRLFPGINYFSVTGFDAVMRTLVVPALKKQFVDLINLPEEEIAAEQMSEVAEVLPSKGYEWQDDPAWQVRFQELLAA